MAEESSQGTARVRLYWEPAEDRQWTMTVNVDNEPVADVNNRNRVATFDLTAGVHEIEIQGNLRTSNILHLDVADGHDVELAAGFQIYDRGFLWLKSRPALYIAPIGRLDEFVTFPTRPAGIPWFLPRWLALAAMTLTAGCILLSLRTELAPNNLIELCLPTILAFSFVLYRNLLRQRERENRLFRKLEYDRGKRSAEENGDVWPPPPRPAD